MEHTPAYRLRRIANWFPLGITYATFYMGRYNFNVVKGDMGKMFHLDKAEMGLIATAGFWTYALSVIFNGPSSNGRWYGAGSGRSMSPRRCLTSASVTFVARTHACRAM